MTKENSLDTITSTPTGSSIMEESAPKPNILALTILRRTKDVL